MSAITAVQELIDGMGKGGTLTNLKVCTDHYRALEAECAPKTPSEYFGFTIEIDSRLDDPDFQAVLH